MATLNSLIDWLGFGVAVIGFTATWIARRRLKGTTLAVPCIFAMLSAISLAIFGLLDATWMNTGENITGSALRFAVGTTTFCPIVSVLGAKRPQHRGWIWVVLSLWLILNWPAGEAVAFPAGRSLDLSTIWKFFVLGLILLGLMNYLPTRFWTSAILIGLGQLLLMDEFTFRMRIWEERQSLLVGFVLVTLGAVLALRSISRVDSSSSVLEHYEKQWLWFRNCYGSFWALRVLQRVNQTANLRDWPFRLSWTGFERVSTEASKDQQQLEEEVKVCFDSLLRRFI